VSPCKQEIKREICLEGPCQWGLFAKKLKLKKFLQKKKKKKRNKKKKVFLKRQPKQEESANKIIN